MARIVHHAIIVTGWDRDELAQAHAMAEELGCTVSPIVRATSTGYASFLVAPDGSRETSPESNLGYGRRAELRAALRSSGLQWIELAFGPGRAATEIVAEYSRPPRGG